MNKINIIHAHNISSEIIGCIVKVFNSCKMITTIHSVCKSDFNSKLKSRIYPFIEYRMLIFNKKYVFVSQQLYASFMNKKKSNKFTIVENGIKPIDKMKNNELNDIFTICSIGRLVEVKAHKKLLKAIKILKDKGIILKCIIAGDGKLMEELINLSADYGINEYVDFIGFIEDVSEVFNKCNAYIIHSNMEGLPITVLEAMSFEVPIITSGVGGIKEVLDKKSCIYMNNNDPDEIARAINFAKENKIIAKQKAKIAKEIFNEKYNLNIFQKRYKDIYLEI